MAMLETDIRLGIFQLSSSCEPNRESQCCFFSSTSYLFEPAGAHIQLLIGDVFVDVLFWQMASSIQATRGIYRS